MNEHFHKVGEKVILANIGGEQADQVEVRMGKVDTQLERSKRQHLSCFNVFQLDWLFGNCKFPLPVVNELSDGWEYIDSFLVDIVVLDDLIFLPHEML